MARLNPAKLHIRHLTPAASEDLSQVRYTLTHSDRTGDLFLAIGADYDKKALSGWRQRFMRDEVLAEWRHEQGVPVLQVYCHVSGGLILGGAAWRSAIFDHHMTQVLQAFRYGDRHRFEVQPSLDRARVQAHFRSHRKAFDQLKDYGLMDDYVIVEPT